MKQCLIFLICSLSFIYGQKIQIEGKVIESESLEPIYGVNITVENSKFGVSTSESGEFTFESDISENDSIYFSALGYAEKGFLVKELLSENVIIRLDRIVLDFGKLIVVDGLIAKEDETPASFSKIERKQIEEDYTIQDIPEYLSYLPSSIFHSESGNGLGYNFLRIRGFGQRRISISYNGIPQNDPEDHNVYWHNITDLLESAELVQVQRGAGSGIIGYPSIGGSINIITSPFSDKPKFEVSSSFGSYNTRKYGVKFSSGLVNNKYSVYAKLSKVLSDGYRDNSWVDFNSYHISAARYDENVKTILNLYGGPVSDGLSYFGIDKDLIKNKKLRTSNILSKNEVEEFSQPHYELLNEININSELTLNSALFYVSGEGFFDYDGSWSVYYPDYFRLIENGFTSDLVPTNALIRAQVENKQWGWIPRITWEHDSGTLIFGAEYRNHRSIHWGAIKFGENIPVGVKSDYKYYYYRGGKDIANFFVNENYFVTEKMNLMGEIQLSYHKYKLFNERYLDNDISIDGLYVNPKFGLNYKFTNKLNAFASFARVTREPRLKTYYDAAESSGGAVPQFAQLSSGIYDFEDPLVKPEVMNNIELGARFNSKNLTFNVNLFYMQFEDEIVPSGQLDRFGQPITGNIENTIHSGIEVDGQVKLADFLSLIYNASYSKNFIQEGTTFITSPITTVVNEIDLSDNSIAGFPEITMNAILQAEYKNVFFRLSAKYVGDYFSDNYDSDLSQLLSSNEDFVSYTDNKVDSYFVFNLMSSYTLKINNTFDNIKLFGQLNNVFDKLYASYATGGDFFPAAERNFLVGVKLGF